MSLDNPFDNRESQAATVAFSAGEIGASDGPQITSSCHCSSSSGQARLHLLGGANEHFANADVFGLGDSKDNSSSDILASQGRDALLGLLLGLPHLGIRDVLPQFG